MKFFIWTLLLTHAIAQAAGIECGEKSVQKENPLYPAVEVYGAVICNPRLENKKLITSFEDLLMHNSFRLPIEAKDGIYHLHLGPTGSFSVWRDLINLNLGRAYYEERELNKAIKYWESIVPSSPYYPLSVLESNYARLDAGEVEKAKIKLQELKNFEGAAEIKQEIKLQDAFIKLRSKDFKSAAQLARNLSFKEAPLEELRLTVLSEALFSEYLGQHNTLSFKDKISTLKLITEAMEAISPSKRKGNLPYLAAEAYWHTAVAYRIEDPDKYQSLWHRQLEVADSWISPVVEKSIAEGKAHLSEEAFFFSIALLWEKEDHQKALVRLKALDKLYPHGVYREDAYQLLGDYYFDEHNFKKAVKYYRQLAHIGSESKAAYGVYKAAWCFYNDKEKWKALRHFERLFKFYLEKRKTEGEQNYELQKEARQDLLLVISEIQNSSEGIEELKTFKLGDTETKEMVRDLAKLYQRNGNYQDSTKTWSYLLTRHLDDKAALTWLIELSLDHYADGKRETISHKINEYYLPWKSKHFSAELDETFSKEWAKIILSLHREAKKSEDPLYWKATDLAYQTYESLRPNGKEGEVWYYGAQKFQFQNDQWKSVEWFKRAADVKIYESSDDAALSALGLLNDLAGNLSIAKNKESHKTEYAKLASYTSWFFERESKTLNKQKELAHFLYVEALFHTGEYLKARKFLVNLFNDPIPNPEAWNVYVSHNQRLYSKKIILEAYELSRALLETKLGKEREKLSLLTNVAQENAFQMAFNAEQEKPVNLKALRRWYEVAFTLSGADNKMKIKSWHNYLLSFNHAEAGLFEERLKQFVQEWDGKDNGAHELYFNIFAKALRLFDEAKLPYKKADYLYLTSKYTTNSKLQDSLLWDAVIVNANFHRWKEVNRTLNLLKERDSGLLKDPKYRAILARYSYLQGEAEESWQQLEPLLSSKDIPASSWLLLYDLFWQSSVRNKVSEFLLTNEQELSSVHWLKPLWSQLKEAEYLSKVNLQNVSVNRIPASINEDDTNETKAFKERLNEVALIYKIMNKKKEVLNNAVISWIPVTASDAICRAPAVTAEALTSLQKLKKNPIKSEQWEKFVSRLNEKNQELTDLINREKQNCESARDEIVFVGGFKRLPSPFCESLGCYQNKKITTQDLIKLENSEEDKKDNFISFLYHGAWARAEALAAEEKDAELQIYFYALMRLATDDTWNAINLLGTLEKSDQWRERAHYLKALVAERRERKTIAESLAPNEIKLSIWEKKLFGPN